MEFGKFSSSKKGRRCEKGFTLVVVNSQKTCQDIDECTKYKRLCYSKHCINTVGSYFCGCESGYATIENGCFDINECLNFHQCPKKADCKNTQGNFTCQCYAVYEGTFCTDIDECSTNVDDCHTNADCINTD